MSEGRVHDPRAMEALDLPLDGSLFGPGQPCFGCSPDHPQGLRLRFAKADGAILTRFTPGDLHQGPPGIMHGGLVSTLADEVAAWACIGLLGKFGFTAQMSLRLARPVRVGVPLVARAVVVKDARRIVDVGVRVEQEGLDALTGELRFVILDKGGAEKMLGGPIPPAWERFCR
jgi:acyl-coenzyme A thioesterase PaaI-like protein